MTMQRRAGGGRRWSGWGGCNGEWRLDGVLFNEGVGGEEDGGGAHEGEDEGVDPEVGEAGAAEDDASDDADVVGGGDDGADSSEEGGHGGDLEDVAGEEDGGEDGAHGELKGFGLGGGAGGDDEADAQDGEKERQGHEQEENQAAVDGDLEDEAHEREDEAEFAEGECAVGDHLADHEAERGDGGHLELLEGAVLALADEGEGDEQDDHNLQEDGDEAGDEEVCAAGGWVVEDGGADLDGLGGEAGDAGEGLFEGYAGGGVYGDAGDGGVGAVDEDEDGGGAAELEVAGVVVGDADGDLGAAGTHGGIHLRGGLGVGGDLEDVRGGEGLDEAAGLLGVGLVEEYGGDLADVGVDCVAEEEELEDRDEEGEEERAGVSEDVG